ncbi:MAG TPA: hypothetical protein VEU96_28145 [Bryobacteraceae bacterium]|nr:hypothetical protein [Bryobacteraceae bacterium]
MTELRRRLLNGERGVAVFLWVFAALGIWWKWGKLDSLIWLDPAWWLNEYARYARGELPYRDYYWPYGPLSADVFAWPMHWLGTRFTVAQVVIDIVSLLVIFLVYRIARRLVPSPLAEMIAILLIAVGITARTYFSLFSLIAYAPAVHVGAVGVLLTTWAILAYIDDARPRTAWLALGAWIACLSKHETAVAMIAELGILFVFDRRFHFRQRTTWDWFRTYALRLSLCLAVPAIVYAGWANVAGWNKFLACIQGFGLANIACPWWPTGFGLTGIVVELGEAWLLLAVASLFVPSWRARLGRRRWLICVTAGLAMAGAVAFQWRLISDLLFGHRSFGQRWQADVTELLSTRSVLRPVLVSCYVYLIAIVVSGIRNSFVLTSARFKDLLLVAIPAAMSLRTLFGSLLVLDLLEVPAASYPFLLLVGPYLLYAVLTRRRDNEDGGFVFNGAAMTFCAALLIGYCVIRMVGGYSSMLSNASFGVLQTPAGSILLTNSAIERPILDYILKNTNQSDTILEIPFGGGMSFATGRRSAAYSTIFYQLRPPAAIQEEDLRRIADHPPEVVIAPNEPNFGTLYGHTGTIGCVFPRFVWQPDVPASDPSYIFPFVDYLEHNYRVDRKIGEWILWRPIHHDHGP